jgi:adenine-specific DNA methylase
MDATHEPISPDITEAGDEFALLPPTRYQGSKRRICSWIGGYLATIGFETVLDAFGGTGSVSYMLKHMGKRVTFTDILNANCEMAVALLENDATVLAAASINNLLDRINGNRNPGFISHTFSAIYFTDDENRWLDGACRVIAQMPDRFERAMAWYAVFQAAISKRPYNLFHRANLNIRTAKVERTFGNKTTWDRSFEEHFRHFASQADAAIRPSLGSCAVDCIDVMDIKGDFDLVYIDPPYINGRGTGVDYFGFYHFLEGMLDYDRWPQRIDRSSKHLRLIGGRSVWTDPKRIGEAFESLFDRFKDSQLAISYRSDGIPSIDELQTMLRRQNRRLSVHTHNRYRYALSKNKRSAEVLILVG